MKFLERDSFFMHGARDIMFPEHCLDNGDSMKKKIFVTYNGSIQLHVVVSVACVSSDSVRGTACNQYHSEIEITLHLCYRCWMWCLGVQLFKRFPVFLSSRSVQVLQVKPGGRRTVHHSLEGAC